MRYAKATITSFDVAQMIALRERIQSGDIAAGDLKEFADVIARVSEFLFKMRDVIQAHEELSACNTAKEARWDHCDSIDVNPWDDDKACALAALVNIGRIVYSGAVYDCFRPLDPNDASRSVREQHEQILATQVERVLRGNHVDPDELLNTIPLHERAEPRRFDPDPDRGE